MLDTSPALWRAKVLKAARTLIGTPYAKLDCSHFVHQAYEEAGLKFPYTSTQSFNAVLVGHFFSIVEPEKALPGDLVLYTGHVGIYDPDGCALMQTAECGGKKRTKDMRILSARSGRNLGVEYGRSSWFGDGKYLTWSAEVQEDAL